MHLTSALCLSVVFKQVAGALACLTILPAVEKPGFNQTSPEAIIRGKLVLVSSSTFPDVYNLSCKNQINLDGWTTGSEFESCLIRQTADAFVTTWFSDSPGTSNSNQIIIPGTGTNYSIEWEEVGSPLNNGELMGNGTTTVTFPWEGYYRVSITPGEGTFTRMEFNDGGDHLKIALIEQWGTIPWASFENAYYGCSMDITATDIPDLSAVTSMRNSFRECHLLTGNTSIGQWDVSGVTDMSHMFRENYLFNQDLGDWNTANVTDMESMFSGAVIFNQDIGGWNTASVTDMRQMFFNAESFNQNLGNWNTGAVTEMSSMFSNASSFNGNIGGWNTNNVTNMEAMFRQAQAFDHPIGNWNTGNVTNMRRMFNDATSFNQNINNWNTSGVTSMDGMFWGADIFNGDIGSWNTTNVTNMSQMFSGASSFNQDIGDWDMQSVLITTGMFSDATSFDQDIGQWDLSNALGIGAMFWGATSFNQDIGSWSFPNVTNLSTMFREAIAFNQDISGWNVSGIVNMHDMFRDASNFNQDISNWSTANVTDMSGMFLDASSFNQDIGSWSLNPDVDLTNMLNGAGLSCEKYDSTLIGWHANPLTPDSLVLGAIGLIYWLSESARTNLTNSKGWTISGDTFQHCNYIADYEITTTDNHLVITDLVGRHATLSTSQSGNNIHLNDLSGTFSLDGGPITAMPAEVPLAGLLSVTINTAGGNDIIHFLGFNSSLPDLTINGGSGDDEVIFSNDLTFHTNANLDIDLQDDHPDPGSDRLTLAAGTNLLLTGSGAATIKVSRNALLNSGASIETDDGDLLVEANQQTSATGGSFIGIDINGGTIQAHGIGELVVKGRGGTTGHNQYGIQLRSAGKIIGGTSDTLTVEGTGGNTSGNSNYGIYVNGANAQITSAGGDCEVIGTGGGNGSSQANYGVYLFFDAKIFAGGDGHVSVLGTGGNAGGSSLVNFGVNVLFGSKIFSDGMGIVVVEGVGGNSSGTGSLNAGVNVSGMSSSFAQITSSGGNVTVTGTGGGGGTGSANYGIWVQSGGEITAGGNGTVNVTGQGGNDTGPGEGNIGVLVDGLDFSPLQPERNIAETLPFSNARITSSGGHVIVTGTGGGASTSYYNHGVSVVYNGQISAGDGGNVTVIGIGSNTVGGLNHGVEIYGDSWITSSGGDVNVNGDGGSSGDNNYGIYVAGFGVISAGDDGNIDIHGTGGSGTGVNNRGVFVSQANAKITSSGGDVTVTGIEGGGTDGTGIVHENDGVITTAVLGGDITLIANSMRIDAGIITNAPSHITVMPYTEAIETEIGTTGDPLGGPLQLTDAELDAMVTGTLIIGSDTSGAITVSADITRPDTTHMELHSVDDILISGGQLHTGGGTLLLNPGTTPAAVKPLHAGIDVSASVLSFGSDLAMVIDGPLVDVDYDQLHINGMIDLTDAGLVLSGGYMPSSGHEFIIIQNDSTDAIAGFFTGLPQYTLLPDFLGSDLDAVISYNGGTGNDCVIKVGVFVWEGTISADWHEPANWSRGTMPTIDDYVFIPVTSNDPIIGSMTQAYARGIDIATNATLTVLGMLDVEEN